MPATATFGEPNEGFDNQTLRQIVHLSVGGTKVRVRISNRHGETPLSVGAVRVAHSAGGASIVLESNREATFAGSPAIVIPPGATVLSDPVDLAVPACADLAVSIYVPEPTGSATWHELGQQTAYISPPGDFTASAELPTQATSPSRYFLSVVEVLAPQGVFSVVAFGDSITDGWASTPDANRRWPDFFSHHINGCEDGGERPFHHPRGRVGVLNQGVSGNRLLRDVIGPGGLARFDRDVLAQVGATHVIVLIGINDIGLSGSLGEPRATAAELRAGLSQLGALARARGLRVYGATLTPYEGTTFPGYYSPDGEVTRQELNVWIRTGDAFDGVIDFDAALRDPEHPTQLLPAYDSGDHLHPSDAGYEAMAAELDALAL